MTSRLVLKRTNTSYPARHRRLSDQISVNPNHHFVSRDRVHLERQSTVVQSRIGIMVDRSRIPSGQLWSRMNWLSHRQNSTCIIQRPKSTKLTKNQWSFPQVHQRAPPILISIKWPPINRNNFWIIICCRISTKTIWWMLPQLDHFPHRRLHSICWITKICNTIRWCSVRSPTRRSNIWSWWTTIRAWIITRLSEWPPAARVSVNFTRSLMVITRKSHIVCLLFAILTVFSCDFSSGFQMPPNRSQSHGFKSPNKANNFQMPAHQGLVCTFCGQFGHTMWVFELLEADLISNSPIFFISLLSFIFQSCRAYCIKNKKTNISRLLDRFKNMKTWIERLAVFFSVNIFFLSFFNSFFN